MVVRNALLGGTDYQDTGSTTLNGGIDDSVTTITVASTAAFKAAGIILIDSERISYTSTNATQFLGCTRGVYGSTNVTHSNGVTVLEREIILSTDLNDTFDVAANYAKTLTAFWFNSYLRTLYDNFSTYTTDADVPTTLWTTSLTGAGIYTATFKTRATTLAGGSSKEGELYASAGNSAGSSARSTTKIKTPTANTHKFIKIYNFIGIYSSSSSTAGNGSCQVSFDNDATQHTMLSFGNPTARYTIEFNSLNIILVVAKGANEYDCYIGGKLVQTVTSASFSIMLICNGNYQSTGTSSALMTFSDVYESSGTV